MRRFLKIVLIVAVANLLLVGISYTLLVASVESVSIGQLLGFVPSPPPSHWETLLVNSFGVLTGPLSWIADVKTMFAFVVYSLLNSIIWGLCLGLPVYALKQRLRARTG